MGSEGEVAGVAVGAAVGGIVLLGLVGLVLRSLLFKEAKPVFTCLEKATPNEKKLRRRRPLSRQRRISACGHLLTPAPARAARACQVSVRRWQHRAGSRTVP